MRRAENTKSSASVTKELCLKCGLCCNGVLFADVRLTGGDQPDLLQAAGVRLIASKKVGGLRFNQPCAALDGCRCRVYESRPTQCRRFECLLYKKVDQGALDANEALQVIAQARKRAEIVRSLLQAVGDSQENLPLRIRFQRKAKQLEKMRLTAETSDKFSRLSLEVHELNLLLSEKFYPGNGGPSL